ncbi:MAG: zinc ribbon domain-containing protein [Schaedlerella sp.]|nr:zinc ribbon domain-containing protein [Lachnospiraceae bacterium]MDY4202755.1 zinc ribbon domain-containing protein [Schaedlerella sp.]
MDAKQRAQFINAQSSPSEPAIKICSNCGAEVRGKFCTKCGTKYEAPKPAVKEEPADNLFAEVKEEPVTNPFAEVKEESVTNPFAEVKEEPVTNPFAEVKEEPATNPFAEMKKEPVTNPFAEVKKEPADNPFTAAVEKPEVTPAVEELAKRDKQSKKRGFSFQPVSLTEDCKEERSALAKGLPEWNIEPPQVVVRRKRR